MQTSTGKCDCGEVEFAFTGEPINSSFCYCHSCQLHTNSDKWFGVWVPKENFKFTKGEPSTFTRIGDSGNTVEYTFCGNCGVTLAGFPELAGFYSVAAMTIENGSKLSPGMLMYTAHAPEWATFPGGIPKFDLLPPGLGDNS
jgi:hypothetical protein